MSLSRRALMKCGVAAGAALWPLTARADVLLPGLVVNGSVAPAEREPLPNIVLMMSDDQGWGDVGYYGGDVQTPNLDAMAAAGLRLDRMYAAAPVCSPTRASVLTGRHPNRYGTYSWNYAMPSTETTLAEVLRDAGYATGHFGKWHVGEVAAGKKRTPMDQGFEECLSHHHHFDQNPLLYRNGVAEQFAGEDSDIVVDAAIEFMQRHAQAETPFFAVVWFPDAHTPHIASQADVAAYAEEAEDVRNYYGEITAMDRAIGRLRDELQALGVADNTLLWFCGDNGGREWFGNTGGHGGKGQIWEGGLRVPGIIEWPGRIAAGRSSSTPVTTLDIMPTVLEAVGLEMPTDKPVDGVSVLALLDGEAFDHAPIGFWQFVSTDPNPVEPPIGPHVGHAAWLDWPWKLHKWYTPYGLQTALYNLLADPYEAQNLKQRESLKGRVAAMRDALEAWQASVVGEMLAHSGESYYQAGQEED